MIYGYGIHGNDVNFVPGALYRAWVTIDSYPVTDFYLGPGILVRRWTGIQDGGDSGGPLFVNNGIVGISSGTAKATWPNVGYVAWLGAQAYWIFNTAHPVSVASKGMLNILLSYGINPQGSQKSDKNKTSN
jgi:hypothetical protein